MIRAYAHFADQVAAHSSDTETGLNPAPIQINFQIEQHKAKEEQIAATLRGKASSIHRLLTLDDVLAAAFVVSSDTLGKIIQATY